MKYVLPLILFILVGCSSPVIKTTYWAECHQGSNIVLKDMSQYDSIVVEKIEKHADGTEKAYQITTFHIDHSGSNPTTQP